MSVQHAWEIAQIISWVKVGEHTNREAENGPVRRRVVMCIARAATTVSTTSTAARTTNHVRAS